MISFLVLKQNITDHASLQRGNNSDDKKLTLKFVAFMKR